jgi:hypothetical protein
MGPKGWDVLRCRYFDDARAPLYAEHASEGFIDRNWLCGNRTATPFGLMLMKPDALSISAPYAAPSLLTRLNVVL